MRQRVFLVVVLILMSAAAPADVPPLTIELNKLEQEEEACRAYLVLENATESAFEALSLDLVLFDPDGVVARRLAVDVAPLAAEKTSLKVFDIDRLACEEIGRVLLNDVLACADAAGTRDDCLERVSPTARGAVPFLK